MSDSIPAAELRSKAWLLRGLFGSMPGILQLSGERLSFTAVDSGTLWRPQLHTLGEMAQQPELADRLERGDAVQIFAVSLKQITQVVFPWYYFGGGASVVIDSVRYRFSFLKPQNAKWPEPRPKDVLKTAVKIIEIGGEITEGRCAGKAWKAALLGQRHAG